MTSDLPEFEVQIAEDGRVSFAHPGQARAYLRGKFRGQTILAQFYAHGAKRTHPQNSGFHAMVTPWAKAEGHLVDHLKRDLLKAVFGTVEVVSLVTGLVSEEPAEPHTSKLTKAQFIELIDRTLEIAAESGHILVAPDEYRKAKAAEARKKARAA